MPTLADLQSVLAPLLAAGGGGAVIAYLLFKSLGEKWIEKRVATALASQKHAYEVELKNLQRKIDDELSRSGKLQEREFVVLPEAWRLLCDADDALARLVALFRQYPDLNRYSPAELDEFLAACPFSDATKQKIREATDKFTTYKDIQHRQELHEAKKALHAYTSYVRRNAIFLHEELRASFEKISEVIWHTIIDREVGEEAKEPKWWAEASKKAREEVAPLARDIQRTVQQALLEGR